MKQLIIDNIQLTEIVLPLIDGKPPVTMTSRDGSVNIRYEEVDDDDLTKAVRCMRDNVLKEKRLADARQIKCPTT